MPGFTYASRLFFLNLTFFHCSNTLLFEGKVLNPEISSKVIVSSLFVQKIYDICLVFAKTLPDSFVTLFYFISLRKGRCYV